MSDAPSPPQEMVNLARDVIDSCDADWSNAERMIAIALTETRTKALEEAARTLATWPWSDAEEEMFYEAGKGGAGDFLAERIRFLKAEGGDNRT